MALQSMPENTIECTIVETIPTLPHKLITSLANFSNSDQALATYTSQPLYV